MTVVNFKRTVEHKRGFKYGRILHTSIPMKYKVPKIGTATDKGKWLNAFIKKFFVVGNHDYSFPTTKNYIKLKTTHFNIVNTKDALVGFFKNLKKLKQDQFVGEVFNVQLLTLKEAAWWKN